MNLKCFFIFQILFFDILLGFTQGRDSIDLIKESKNLEKYYTMRKDTTLGNYFQAMNQIRIGMTLYRISQSDSSVLNHLWAALSLHKEQGCNCLNTLEKAATLPMVNPSYKQIQNLEWKRILKFCNYRLSPTSNPMLTGSLNNDLKILLDNDQKYREMIGILSFILGETTNEVQNLVSKQNELDSINLKEIEKIFQINKGYPHHNQVSEDLFNVPALVIIHCNKYQTQEKYLPVILGAVKFNKLPSENIKLLIDKIYVQKNKKQVFGTQYGFYDERTKKTGQYPLLDEPIRKSIIENLNLN